MSDAGIFELCAAALADTAARLERAHKTGEVVRKVFTYTHFEPQKRPYRHGKRRPWNACCVPLGPRFARGIERRIWGSRKGGAVRPRTVRAVLNFWLKSREEVREVMTGLGSSRPLTALVSRRYRDPSTGLMTTRLFRLNELTIFARNL